LIRSPVGQAAGTFCSTAPNCPAKKAIDHKNAVQQKKKLVMSKYRTTRVLSSRIADVLATTAQGPSGHMLLTNPIINMGDDHATVHVLWAGVMNEGLAQAPSLCEQGHEYSELRKVNGIRYITSDSGLPDRFASYQSREHR
jgi:hypothetical protein